MILSRMWQGIRVYEAEEKQGEGRGERKRPFQCEAEHRQRQNPFKKNGNVNYGRLRISVASGVGQELEEESQGLACALGESTLSQRQFEIWKQGTGSIRYAFFLNHASVMFSILISRVNENNPIFKWVYQLLLCYSPIPDRNKGGQGSLDSLSPPISEDNCGKNGFIQDGRSMKYRLLSL